MVAAVGDASVSLTDERIMVERPIGEGVVRYARITSGADSSTFVMSYGDNDMDARVWGTRAYIGRMIAQFVVQLHSKLPRE